MTPEARIQLKKRLELYGLKPVINREQRNTLEEAVAYCKRCAAEYEWDIGEVERVARASDITVPDQIAAIIHVAINCEPMWRAQVAEADKLRKQNFDKRTRPSSRTRNADSDRCGDAGLPACVFGNLQQRI
jgi:hypothetical protein